MFVSESHSHLAVGLVLAILTLEGSAVFTRSMCYDELKKMDPLDFGERTLACRMAGEINTDCCAKMMDLYGYYGDLDGCLCVSEFHSLLLESMPVDKGITPDIFLNDLKGCGIPAKGLGCGGQEEAPVVNSQVALGLAVRSIFRSGLAAGAALGSRSGFGNPYGYGQIGDDDDDDDDGARPRPVPIPAYSPPPKSPKPSPKPKSPPSTAAANATVPAPLPKATGASRLQNSDSAPPPTTNSECYAVTSSAGAVDLSMGAQCVILQSS